MVNLFKKKPEVAKVERPEPEKGPYVQAGPKAGKYFMDLKTFIKSRFKKDIFSINQEDILRERLKIEKRVEQISDDIKKLSQKIQQFMLESKGQPQTLKMLNVEKIKAVRLESSTKHQEASRLIKELQLLLLVEAMKERQRLDNKSAIVDRILSSDISKLNDILTDTDVMKALEEGRMDDIKDRLGRIFAKEDMPIDGESHEILRAIEDLEKVDEETALQMAGEKAKELSETTKNKRISEEKE
jgi:hypothetical protein